jgi:inorganic pyrophosphatase
MSFHNVKIGSKMPKIVRAIIEIPKGGHNKYEYDEKLDLIRLDRVLHSPLFYPVDYGFIPETRAEDGDHLDVMVITDSPVFSGCVMDVRPIGVLKMSDEHGSDDKLLSVPFHSPRFKRVKSTQDLEPHILKEIVHFFEQYKTLEKKIVEVHGWGGCEESYNLIKKTNKIFLQETQK